MGLRVDDDGDGAKLVLDGSIWVGVWYQSVNLLVLYLHIDTDFYNHNVPWS